MIIPLPDPRDSIADGTGAALLSAIGDRCAVLAKVGASSSAILRRAPAGSFASAAISAGSNDPNNFDLASNLLVLRPSVSAAKVVWIIPYNRRLAVSSARSREAIDARRALPADIDTRDYAGSHPLRLIAGLGHIPALDQTTEDARHARHTER